MQDLHIPRQSPPLQDFPQPDSMIKKLNLLNIENERLKKIIQDYERRVQQCLDVNPHSTNDDLNAELKRFKTLANQKSLEIEEWKSRYNEAVQNSQMQEKFLNETLCEKFQAKLHEIEAFNETNLRNLKADLQQERYTSSEKTQKLSQ
jgi:hypothetical protein